MKYYNTIDSLIEDFDFEKVHKVMTFLDWKWRGEAVPSVEKIKAAATSLLHQLVRSDSQSISSGGLRVLKMNYDGRKYLSLMFCVQNNDIPVEHLIPVL